MAAAVMHKWGESPAADRVIGPLSGLAPSMWERRVLMNLQAYIDESQDEEFFTLAGYIAAPQDWAKFAQEWEKILHFAFIGPNNVRRFKMSEMHSGGRADYANVFYHVIQQHVRSGISITFKISDLGRALDRITLDGKPINWGLWRNPYVFAVRGMTDFLNRCRDEVPANILGPDDKIDFIFDDKKFEKSVIITGWDMIRENMPKETAALYGISPRFEDDEEYMPLQAADFWAWWIRRWASEQKDASKWGAFPWDMAIKDKPYCLSYSFTEAGIVRYVLSQNFHFASSGQVFEVLPEKL